VYPGVPVVGSFIVQLLSLVVQPLGQEPPAEVVSKSSESTCAFTKQRLKINVKKVKVFS
jgi:hypothetical protein